MGSEPSVRGAFEGCCRGEDESVALSAYAIAAKILQDFVSPIVLDTIIQSLRGG